MATRNSIPASVKKLCDKYSRMIFDLPVETLYPLFLFFGYKPDTEKRDKWTRNDNGRILQFCLDSPGTVGSTLAVHSRQHDSMSADELVSFLAFRTVKSSENAQILIAMTAGIMPEDEFKKIKSSGPKAAGWLAPVEDVNRRFRKSLSDGELDAVKSWGCESVPDHLTVCRIAAELSGLDRTHLAVQIRTGQSLLEVKAMLPHGEFESWVEKHIRSVTKRTALNYLGIARFCSSVFETSDCEQLAWRLRATCEIAAVRILGRESVPNAVLLEVRALLAKPEKKLSIHDALSLLKKHANSAQRQPQTPTACKDPLPEIADIRALGALKSNNMPTKRSKRLLNAFRPAIRTAQKALKAGNIAQLEKAFVLLAQQALTRE